MTSTGRIAAEARRVLIAELRSLDEQNLGRVLGRVARLCHAYRQVGVALGGVDDHEDDYGDSMSTPRMGRMQVATGQLSPGDLTSGLMEALGGFFTSWQRNQAEERQESRRLRLLELSEDARRRGDTERADRHEAEAERLQAPNSRLQVSGQEATARLIEAVGSFAVGHEEALEGEPIPLPALVAP